MATYIHCLEVNGDGPTTERRSGQCSQIGSSGLTAAREGKARQPINEGIVDLRLGQAIANGGIWGTIGIKQLWWVDGKKSGATLRRTTSIVSHKSNHDRTTTRIRSNKRGQIGGVHIASAGESKLVDPVIKDGLNGGLRQASTQINISGTGDGDRCRWTDDKGSGAVIRRTACIGGHKADGGSSPTGVRRLKSR